jgi:hypothetical protein
MSVAVLGSASGLEWLVGILQINEYRPTGAGIVAASTATTTCNK